MSNEPPDTGRPLLRVVRGNPTDAEVAALVVAVASQAAAAAAAPGTHSLWRSRSRNIRPAVSPSPGAWRASGLPR
jgi:Acyl-CoA carboxylase epsilon subunit